MIFLLICFLLVVIRLSFRKLLPWKVISASSVNLAGVLLFIGLGLEFCQDCYDSSVGAVAMVVVFYFFLIIGELLARRVKLDHEGWANLGDRLRNKAKIRHGLLILVVVYVLLSFAPVLTSGESIGEQFESRWMASGLEERSANLVEYLYGYSSRSQVDALVIGIRSQLDGFWYLGLGVASLVSPFLTYFLLIVLIFGTFLTSGGSRSFLGTNIMMLALLWLQTVNPKKKIITIVVISLVAIGLLISMDILLLGRQGREASGGLSERVKRTLSADFAYGGFGLELASRARPATFDVAIDYLARLFLMPVPRVLWSGKYTVGPNWEMTEAYFGTSLYRIGSIRLFTPLGEALFYFGYMGLVLVPFLFGFTTALLERIYLTSPTYRGLLVQVYVYAVFAMRQSFWTLFQYLITANFLAIMVLIFVKRSRFSRRAAKVPAHFIKANHRL